jgi:hypothetical protein
MLLNSMPHKLCAFVDWTLILNSMPQVVCFCLHNYFLKERNWSNIDKNLKLLLEICQLFWTNFKLNTWPWEQKPNTFWLISGKVLSVIFTSIHLKWIDEFIEEISVFARVVLLNYIGWKPEELPPVLYINRKKLPLLRSRHLKGEVMQNMYFYIAYIRVKAQLFSQRKKLK